MIWRIGPNDWPNLSTIIAQGAQPFDTIMLTQAGSEYYAPTVFDVAWPFPMSIFGEPGASQVIISMPRYGWALNLKDMNQAGIIYIENIQTIYSYNYQCNTVALPNTTEDLTTYFNQCTFSGQVNFYAFDSVTLNTKLIIDRCLLGHPSNYTPGGDGQYLSHWDNPASVGAVSVRRTQIAASTAFTSVYGGAISIEDLIAEADWMDQATVGYGPDYLAFLNPAIAPLGGTYRVAGKVTGSNLTKSDVQINLHLATDSGVSPHRYISTNPDPTTGDWEFIYLPSEYKYYVSLIPPLGYKPEILGPYDPEQ